MQGTNAKSKFHLPDYLQTPPNLLQFSHLLYRFLRDKSWRLIQKFFENRKMHFFQSYCCKQSKKRHKKMQFDYLDSFQSLFIMLSFHNPSALILWCKNQFRKCLQMYCQWGNHLILRNSMPQKWTTFFFI